MVTTPSGTSSGPVSRLPDGPALTFPLGAITTSPGTAPASRLRSGGWRQADRPDLANPRPRSLARPEAADGGQRQTFIQTG
jgi:hypothetical protein